jgi:glutaminyl-peptide cyclotransferase
VWYDGALYESTGLYGRSTLRKVDRATGEVLRQTQLDPVYFGEGLGRVDDRLIQITWREGTAHVYQLHTFERVDQYRYDGEGWGLCFDGERLIMTDGGSNLTLRDPRTFEVTGTVPVTLEGRPVDRLNELECVRDKLYANIYMTDQIVRIDPRSGRVEALIDAGNLLSQEERRGTDVLNGIAYDPDQDLFLITGKLWPKLFEVRFVPASS